MAAFDLPKAYDFHSTEQRIYEWWEKQGYFKPGNDPNQPGFDASKKPFVISIPLPNVTGELHHGHVTRGLRVTLAKGSVIEADGVLSAIGLRPRTGLAQRAGLKIGRGIVTDRRLQTSAADVYALGDCAEVEGHLLPYVMPIMQAARALAKTLAGTPTPVTYPAMPVVVKTPAMPVVVCPPPAVPGSWRFVEDASGVEASYKDESGRLLGLALVGAACSRKSALAKRVPPLLG